MKFIDLFCGIGGFHLVCQGDCVLASDIDKNAIHTYEQNFKVKVSGDIRQIKSEDVPHHDILFAGFPCQAFSKAGNQNGFLDSRGTLFFEIERILRHKKPKYIMLENVRNIVSHDDGKTWKVITSILKDVGYRITDTPILVSPDQFGTPQLRPRVVIAGLYDPENINTPITITLNKIKTKSIYDILDEKVDAKYYISAEECEIIEMWDEFYQGIKEKTIGFPVWADYFKVGDVPGIPKWKKDFINKNQNLYNNNKIFIDSWLDKYNNLQSINPSMRKFEWQASENISSVWEGLIQFRPSGVRVKKPNCFPALVAMVQIPVVGKYKRRLTPRECARLQDFPESFIINENDQKAYKQFGNSVNVKVMKAIYEKLLECN